ncbi:hypothetical protein PHAVU_009G005200 [Phaseolus vulgaris]|uniref:Probable histone-arginine methyltransferase CARM1-like N-terminal PH domain-containing protein n=1 Tax=Phaseolus vulgaris TaxID=3885 RepID=V7ARJ3_PHAVU|nr:hypothetical protein PHAVU_009G005200g [Phaseolus vulgaris]ESW07940.1 hypothetical protein PHAVU_009G005200g [Phaseolus vulgaris]
MEDSLEQKWKQREFMLASVSDLSSAPPSASLPGIARFDSDGLQIHHESQQIPLSIDPRTVLGPRFIHANRAIFVRSIRYQTHPQRTTMFN